MRDIFTSMLEGHIDEHAPTTLFPALVRERMPVASYTEVKRQSIFARSPISRIRWIS